MCIITNFDNFQKLLEYPRRPLRVCVLVTYPPAADQLFAAQERLQRAVSCRTRARAARPQRTGNILLFSSARTKKVNARKMNILRSPR